MKQVIITGADRGLGFELCRTFLEEGYHVYAGQYIKEWTELEHLKSHYKDELTIHPLDVSSSDSVVRFVADVSKETKQINMLINNAAIVGNMGELTEDMDVALKCIPQNIPMNLGSSCGMLME